MMVVCIFTLLVRQIRHLNGLLDKHEVEALDSIDIIKSYTIQSTHMSEVLAINHVCNTEYKRLKDMYDYAQ